MPNQLLKLGILLSGRGSNFLAIANSIDEQKLDAQIAVVISNNPAAKGIEIAKSRGFATLIADPKTFPDKTTYEKQILQTLASHQVDLVILAGYMRILGSTLLGAYPERILNIHPSLLPSFKGLHPQQQALDAGVRFSGCTVHFVDDSLDGGPIILQEIVPVEQQDSEDSLSARILEKEHLLYSKCIQLIAQNRLAISDRHVIIS